MNSIERCHNIDDIRRLAAKSIPATFFDFIDGGAEDELTLKANRAAYSQYQFIPRVLVDVSNIEVGRKLLGMQAKMPVILAPTGMTRMFHYQGELAVARAAKKFGIPYTLSTVATTSIENVAAVNDNPLFQIYVWNNLEIVSNFLDRCVESGYKGMMLAVDVATIGNRERDYKHGYGRPIELRLRTALQAFFRPRWLLRFLTSPALQLANLTDFLPPKENVFKSLDNIHGQHDPSVDWSAIDFIRKKWQGPLVIKGIGCLADARRARDAGVDGIVLSNHGGRQLDCAPVALHLLPEIAAEVGKDIDVYIDGGIRRGSDIVKALALGAKAVLIGRSYLYGLSAGGQAGVSYVLQILYDEMVRVMMLIGCSSIDQLDQTYVQRIRCAESEITAKGRNDER